MQIWIMGGERGTNEPRYDFSGGYRPQKYPQKKNYLPTMRTKKKFFFQIKNLELLEAE